MNREPYVMQPHRWDNLRGISWQVCVHCGLVWLKNDFTAWAVRKGCNNADHPSHDSVRARFTGHA